MKKIRAASDFDDLYNVISELVGNIDGIGQLYIYDTAIRIGAYLGFEPQKIYLHAGTLEGAKNLDLIQGKDLF